jgi:membrane protein DedA with SNARE-associated domain
MNFAVWCVLALGAILSGVPCYLVGYYIGKSGK